MALLSSIPGLFGLWLLVAGWRVLLGVTIRTSFDPDEYWQGPEVAHRLVFGYGHLTWEWAAGLRSYAHPLLFTPAYALLKFFREDFPQAVQLAPRLTQVLLTLAHDDCLLSFAAAHLPTRVHRSVWFVSCISWFNCFTHSRPFSNALESTLHLTCLANWPLPTSQYTTESSAQSSHRAKRALAITFAGLCCVIRPPSVVLFLPVAAYELCSLWASPAASASGASSTHSRSDHHITRRLLRCLVFIFDGSALAVVVVLVSGAVDYAFYGRLVFPAWVNLEFNVLQNHSADYGVHPFHWYFTQGVPAMLASLLPLVLWGAVSSAQQRPGPSYGMPLWPLLLSFWGIGIHSVLGHKEFRYILPSFDLLLLYAAVPIADCLKGSVEQIDKAAADVAAPPIDTQDQAQGNSTSADDGAEEKVRHRMRNRHAFKPVQAQQSVPKPPARKKQSSARRLITWRSTACAFCCLLQLPTLAYFGLVHQRGTVAVMEHLSHARLAAGSHILTITNCHATPWQAHMHRKDVRMSFLDCSPTFWYQGTKAQNVEGAIGTFIMEDTSEALEMSEQRAFESDPLGSLCRVYGCGTAVSTPQEDLERVGECEGSGCQPPPSHIIVYDDMATKIVPFLKQHVYELKKSYLQNQMEEKYVQLYARS